MKALKTVGLAVAVSLVTNTVVAVAQVNGAAPAGPTANRSQAHRTPYKMLTLPLGHDLNEYLARPRPL